MAMAEAAMNVTVSQQAEADRLLLMAEIYDDMPEPPK